MRRKKNSITPVDTLPIYHSIDQIDGSHSNIAKERWARAIHSVQTDIHTFKALRGDRRTSHRQGSISSNEKSKNASKVASKSSLTSIHVVKVDPARSAKTIQDAASIDSNTSMGHIGRSVSLHKYESSLEINNDVGEDKHDV